jgi:tetratricopeptide (TPR) repeat protein
VTSSTLELAILHADACGFSAAMALSEDQAIRRLQAGQRLFAQAARMFCGRVVDTAGDSALLTFESAQAAFQAARHVAENIEPFGSAEEEATPFDYRMGLTRGRVRLTDGRVFGHCVNMAARINSLVGRGNVGIERSIWGEVQSMSRGKSVRPRILFAKPDEPFVDFVEVGGRAADNFSHDYHRNAPAIAILPDFTENNGPQHHQHRNAIDAFVWECSALAGAQGWQASVSSRTPHSPTTHQSGADYEVHVRAATIAGGLRLSVSLTSHHYANSARHFTRDAGDAEEHTSNAQALASLVGSAVANMEIDRGEATRAVGSHQLVVAGRARLSAFSARDFAKALTHMKAAQKIDPEYPLLLSSLARAHALAWRFGWADDKDSLLETARKFAEQAVRLAPDDARCQADLGFVRFWSNEPLESAWHYERSLDALPFHPELAADAGMVLSYVERNKEAAAVLERSIANIPNDADYRLWSLGDVYYAKRDYGNSLKWLSRMGDQSQAQRMLAANKARLGLDPSRHVENVLAQQPDFSVRHWVSIQPFTNEKDRIDYEEALLLAGLPL